MRCSLPQKKMPRHYQDTTVPSTHEIDLNYAGEGQQRFQDASSWLSDNNSVYLHFSPNQTWLGEMDRISQWRSAELRVEGAGKLTLLQYEISMDGGTTYPIVIPLDVEMDYFEFPILGQLGRLKLTTSGGWPEGGRLQIALMYRQSPSQQGGAAVTRTGTLLGAETRALNVRVVNEWQDDYFLGKIQGRSTGFCAGYCDSIDSNYQSVHPIASGFVPLPPPTGLSTFSIGSSSVQDSGVGSGVYLYFLLYLRADYTSGFMLLAFDGTTPVTYNTGELFFRFIAAFGIVGGAAYPFNFTSGPVSNVGINYIGTGTFTPASGFTTTYLRNRIGDGQIVSPTYTVPFGKRALLWELKYAAEASKPVIMRTFGRGNPNGFWVLQIEDVAQNTIQPRRSLIGGWNPPGAEFTVVGKKASGTSVLCNFIMTVIEVEERFFASYI